jgi:hypothetical protein
MLLAVCFAVLLLEVITYASAGSVLCCTAAAASRGHLLLAVRSAVLLLEVIMHASAGCCSAARGHHARLCWLCAVLFFCSRSSRTALLAVHARCC